MDCLFDIPSEILLLGEPWMFWEDFFRRTKRGSFPFREDLGRLFEETMREFFDDLSEEFYHDVPRSDGSKTRVFEPFLYGYCIQMESDGRLRIEHFGNITRGDSGEPVPAHEREPVTFVVVLEESVEVVVELPGVRKEDIDLRASPKSLRISAHSDRHGYGKTVELPVRVKTEDVRTTYEDGLFEIVLARSDETTSDKRSVPVK